MFMRKWIDLFESADDSADAEYEEMRARMNGTAPVEPVKPREPTFVPDVGTIIQIDDPHQWSDMGGNVKGKRSYRVNSWLKEAPPPAPVDDDDISGFLGHVLYSSGQKIGPDKKRLMWCARNEAEYLSCSGVSGAIVRVTDAEVIGRVSWPEDQINELRSSAIRKIGQLAG